MNGGFELRPCTVDLDCNAGELCYSNVSWTSEPGCYCNTWFGFERDSEGTCTGLGPTMIFMISSTVVNVLILFYVFSVSLRNNYFAYKLKLGYNATSVTSIEASLSLLFYILWIMFYYLEAFSQENLVEEKNGELFSTYRLYTSVSITLMQAFALLCVSTVSVMWVEVAEAIRTGDNSPTINLKRYRSIVYVVSTLFAILMLSVGLLKESSYVVIAAAPFLVLLALTYLYGRFRLIRLLEYSVSVAAAMRNYGNQETFDKADLSVQAQPSLNLVEVQETVQNDATSRLRRAITNIKRCSEIVIFSCISIITCGLIFYFLTESEGEAGWKDHAPPGQLSAPSLVVFCFPWFMLLTLWAVVQYTNKAVNTTLQRHKETSRPRTDIIPTTNDMT